MTIYCCSLHKLTYTPRSVQVDTDPPAAIQEELKSWPFIWEGRKFFRFGKTLDRTYCPTTYRQAIQSSLQLGKPVLDDHIKFVQDYPMHARWLKHNLERTSLASA
jgi:hypothetical protein